MTATELMPPMVCVIEYRIIEMESKLNSACLTTDGIAGVTTALLNLHALKKIYEEKEK